MPAAAVIMFFSAMPKSKKRSGWRALNSTVRLARGEIGGEHDDARVAIGEVGELLAEHEGRQRDAPVSPDGALSFSEVGRAADAAEEVALVLALRRSPDR